MQKIDLNISRSNYVTTNNITRMNSTKTTQASAENCIANGLTMNISDVIITAPKMNKSGGKSASVLYAPTKKGLYVNLQVPMLTWGASTFKDPQSGKETYDMAIQFPRQDYSTPETETLLRKFQDIEKYIKSEALKNSMAWFNKKYTAEIIDALFTPILKYSKDPHTGESDMTKAPTLKVKLPYWDGKFNCEIYDPNGTILYPDEHSETSPIELIPKGVNIVAIIQCGGLWFANGKFGCTWRLFQAVVQQKPSMKGKCFINVSAEAKSVLAVSNSNESSMVIEDDDTDGEGEHEDTQPQKQTVHHPPPAPARQVPVPTTTTETVSVPEPEPEATVVETAAVAAPVVVKKKVVRKKE